MSISFMERIAGLLAVSPALGEVALDKAISMGASLIFVGVFVLQFFSIYRHGGRDAVVSMLTWLLVACLCLTVAGYYWQQERDVFQAILLLILTGGALSCFMISFASRATIDMEIERRSHDSAAVSEKTAQLEQASAEFRERLAKARQRKMNG